ncbi:MAG: hypothetical protein L6Q97_24990 [Thermoanaerobaculia bacterium]|nr:hypothetical protein [Thermoanaerobaculia bacterium]
MIYVLPVFLAIALFHAWLFAWYFPKHCLSDRKVTWGERYRALLRYLIERLKIRPHR